MLTSPVLRHFDSVAFGILRNVDNIAVSIKAGFKSEGFVEALILSPHLQQ